MTETKIFNNKNEGVSVANSQLYQQLTKITGVLTSNLRIKTSTNVPVMAFFRSNSANKHSLAECETTKCQECEIPIIFKIKDPTCDGSHHLWGENCWIKPKLKKGDKAILEGKFSPSEKSNRPSFTCSDYQLINDYE